jgi:protein kinase A
LNQIERSKNEKMIQFEFLECPFIVNLYKTFQDDCNLYMILEYVSGGELLSWLRVNKKFSLEVLFFLF